MEITKPDGWDIPEYLHINQYEDLIDTKGYNSTIYCYTRGLDFGKHYNKYQKAYDWLNTYPHTDNPEPGDVLVFYPNERIDGLEYPLIAGVYGTVMMVEAKNNHQLLISQPSPFNLHVLEYQVIDVSNVSKYKFITV